jgi:O-6-methylguanine DNA methyltransferase
MNLSTTTPVSLEVKGQDFYQLVKWLEAPLPASALQERLTVIKEILNGRIFKMARFSYPVTNKSQSDDFVLIQMKSGLLNSAVKTDFQIHYNLFESRFGDVTIASTDQGICFVDFIDDRGVDPELNLRNEFPNASLKKQTEVVHINALERINHPGRSYQPITLHLKCTDFQFEVWEQLLSISLGQISSYGMIAAVLKKPGASRAVGTAIGSNPIGYIIPCHRVMPASGKPGGFRWGVKRKAIMLASELN